MTESTITNPTMAMVVRFIVVSPRGGEAASCLRQRRTTPARSLIAWMQGGRAPSLSQDFP
jgi:hypothetical protein